MLTATFVFLGSALGGVLRHALSNVVQSVWRDRFPMGTLAVNVSGALLIGVVWGWMNCPAGPNDAGPSAMLAVSPAPLQFLILGILGGYTTVSSFALNTLELMREKRSAAAGVNLFGSWLLCLLAAFIGYRLATA